MPDEEIASAGFRFLEVQNPFWFWGVVASFLIVAALMMFLARDERRSLPARTRWGLTALRLGLLLLLCIGLLEPVLVQNVTSKPDTSIPIALDVSASMLTTDQQATGEERLIWAEATGLTPASLDGRSDFPQRDSPGVQALLGELDGVSRLELARRTIAEIVQGRSSTLEESGVESIIFASSGRPLPLNHLLTMNLPDDLRFWQAATNLQAIPSELPVNSNGLILISDGRDTSMDDATTIIAPFQERGIPIYAVLAGSTTAQAGVFINAIDAPRLAFTEERTRVRISVQTSGAKHVPVTVALEPLSESTSPHITQTQTSTGDVLVFEFDLAPMPSGLMRYRATAALDETPSPVEPFTQEFSFQVIEGNARVLLIDGEGGWEFRYLNDALGRDDQITFDRVLFRQPRLAEAGRPLYPASFSELQADDPAHPFAAYDVIILGDVSPEDVNAHDWEMLDRFVRDDGGTLVLLAGRRHARSDSLAPREETLLPIEGLRQVEAVASDGPTTPLSRGLRLQLTPDGSRFPGFQWTSERTAAQDRFSALPGHAWGIVGQAKAGATVLATPFIEEGVQSLQQERAHAIMAAQNLGSGHVIWLGVDGTWRWRFRNKDEVYRQFWRQLVRWGAASRRMTGSSSLRITPRHPIIEQGKVAWFDVQIPESLPIDDAHFPSRLILEELGAKQRTLWYGDLEPGLSAPDLWTVRIDSLTPGEYAVSLEWKGTGPAPDLPEARLHVIPAPDVERRNLTANAGLLREIAAATGGEFLHLNELKQLNARVPFLKPASAAPQKILRLWNRWLTLVLFCAIAGTEWIWRKRVGLP